MIEPQTGEIRRINGTVQAGYTTANPNIHVDDTMLLPPSWYALRAKLEHQPPERADTWSFRFLAKRECEPQLVLVLGWTYRQVGEYFPGVKTQGWDSPPEYDPPYVANEQRWKVWICMPLDKHNGRYHKTVAVAEDQFVA